MNDFETKTLRWLPILGEWYTTLDRVPYWEDKNELIKAYRQYTKKDIAVYSWFTFQQQLLVTKIDISAEPEIPHVVQFLAHNKLYYCGFFVPSEDLDFYVPSWHKSFKPVKA